MAQNRLFVPLSRDPFEDFRNRGKLWEIRRYSPNFNEKTVYAGRSVELRLGYSTREDVEENTWRLWRRVGRLYVGSLEDIFFSVGNFKEIEPRFDSLVSALNDNIQDGLVHDKYIGFECLRTD
jgi:hypothetical protein